MSDSSGLVSTEQVPGKSLVHQMLPVHSPKLPHSGVLPDAEPERYVVIKHASN